jgi:transposase
MIIIGVDFHPEFQQIASVDTDHRRIPGKTADASRGGGEDLRALACAGQKVRVGMEASGHARWFERLVAELQIELWIGDAAEIRTKRVRKQKTDRQDAQLILSLLLEDRFPRIWVPSWENRDLRQLLWHRHRMVQARTTCTGTQKIRDQAGQFNVALFQQAFQLVLQAHVVACQLVLPSCDRAP